jgi:kanamycin kinase/aminoglycoside 3'-phosphotransferase-3
MENNKLPYKIKKKIKNMEIIENKEGLSTADVYKCISETENFYLKIDSKNSGLKNEYQNIGWLCGKIPVPKIIEWASDEEKDYLLISELNGQMLCDDYYLTNPYLTVSVLSKGLQLLHSIDITNCKIINNLDKKLSLAKTTVQNNMVDTDDWEEETKKMFQSPGLLLEYLYDNKPKNEELVFTHGDYCLPNIFGSGGEITGFIDLGSAGISDKWQDIAICIRSLNWNFNTNEYENVLLENLGIEKDTIKFNYYILLYELF